MQTKVNKSVTGKDIQSNFLKEKINNDDVLKISEKNSAIDVREEANREYSTTVKELNSKYLIDHIVSEEDFDIWSLENQAVGEKIRSIPKCKTIAEANYYLKNYYAAKVEAKLKYEFIGKYGAWSIPAINAEIKEMDNFIADALKLSFSQVADIDNYEKTYDTERKMFEIVRLKNNYYESMMFEPHRKIRREVYGMYFLFNKFLKSKLNKNEIVTGLTASPKYDSLDDLFKEPEYRIKAYEALKDAEIINEEFQIIINLKSAFCVWIAVLKHKQLIHHITDDGIFADLLSKKFKNFTIEKSLFRKRNKNAEDKYKKHITDFLALV